VVQRVADSEKNKVRFTVINRTSDPIADVQLMVLLLSSDLLAYAGVPSVRLGANHRVLQRLSWIMAIIHRISQNRCRTVLLARTDAGSGNGKSG
jgi:hypothetical protein